MKIPAIETTRLLLRGFTKEDALWAFRIWNDPEVGKYLPDEPMLLSLIHISEPTRHNY